MKFIRYNDNLGILYDDFTERYVRLKQDSIKLLESIVYQKEKEYTKEDVFRIKRLLQLNILNFENKKLSLSKDIRLNKIQGEVEHPFVAYWLITNKCNFNCKHCCWGQHRAMENELSIEESKEMINQLIKMGIVRLSISGGEPLCEYNKLLESIKYASQKGIESVCIATNGSLLNEARIKELAEAGVKEFQFSIDDVDSASHNKQRGMNNFEHIQDCISIIKKNNLLVSAGITLNKKNLHKIEMIIDSIINDLKITKMKIVRYLPIIKDEYSKELEISNPKDIAFAVIQMGKIQAKYVNTNIDVKIPAIAQSYWRFVAKQERLESSCEALKLRMCIMANGSIAPCPILSSLGVIVGNIRNDSIENILNNSKSKEIVNWKGKDKCRSCEYFNFCAGGCLANSINYYDTTDDPDKWCLKEYKEFV